MGVKDKSGKATYFMYDRRLRLLRNTLDKPADVASSTKGNTRCPAVVRNFINEKTCVRRPKGSCTQREYQSLSFKLDTAMMRFWYVAMNKSGNHEIQGRQDQTPVWSFS